MFYTLQIEGFPPDPNVPLSQDLTGDGIDLLQAEIRVFDAATQLQNSTGSQGGTAYDISPTGVNTGDLSALGDSRIVWACPLTNDYYIRIRHRRELTGIGAYGLRLASSQLMTILQEEPLLQTGARLVRLEDDTNGVFFFDWVSSAVKANRFEFIESLGNTVIQDFLVGPTNQRVFLPGQATPQPMSLHMHVGFPNIFAPGSSLNGTDLGGDEDPHPFVLDIPLTSTRDTEGQKTTNRQLVQAMVVDGGDLGQVRIPVNVEQTGTTQTPDGEILEVRTSIDLGGAVSENGNRGGSADLTEEVLRTFFGFPWYLDVHIQPNLTLDPLPVTVSLPQADLYQFFESDLVASPINVVLRDGSRLTEDQMRGFGEFSIFYDSSLKTFQVAEQQYFIQANPFPVSSVINPDYAAFVGDRVRVHSGGPGETGPVIIDLGTLPPLTLKSFIQTVTSEPGTRVPIRQITDVEAERLREAFYNEGFYVQVTDAFTGAPISRAEGLLEISSFPTLEPCSFPPCGSVSGPDAPYRKGVVNFATSSSDHGSISVVLNGEPLGSLTRAVSPEDVPACGPTGDDRTLSADLWPEKYFWHARAVDGTRWEGYVTVGSESCETVLLE